MNIAEASGWIELLTDGPDAALQVAAAMQQGRVLELDTPAALDAARLYVEWDVSPSAGTVPAARPSPSPGRREAAEPRARTAAG